MDGIDVFQVETILFITMCILDFQHYFSKNDNISIFSKFHKSLNMLNMNNIEPTKWIIIINNSGANKSNEVNEEEKVE